MLECDQAYILVVVGIKWHDAFKCLAEYAGSKSGSISGLYYFCISIILSSKSASQTNLELAA